MNKEDRFRLLTLLMTGLNSNTMRLERVEMQMEALGALLRDPEPQPEVEAQ